MQTKVVKKLIAFLLTMSSVTAFAQQKAEYVATMIRFERYFNAGNADSINDMFVTALQPGTWTAAMSKAQQEVRGNIVAFRFIPQPKWHRGAVFNVKFNKSKPVALVMKLNADNKIDSFVFDASNIYIKGLMSTYK